MGHGIWWFVRPSAAPYAAGSPGCDPLAKKTQSAAPASTNPLWITLLAEELNLLDARDFELVARFSGDAGTQTEQLLLEVVGNAPAEAVGRDLNL